MWNKTLGRLVAALLVGGAVLVPAWSMAQTVTPTITPTPTMIPPVTVSLPNAFISAVLQTTDVSVSITNGTGIIAYNLGINFDPTIVHATAAALGTVLTTAPANCSSPTSNFDNVNGRVCVTGTCVVAPTIGGQFLKITFEGEANGISAL